MLTTYKFKNGVSCSDGYSKIINILKLRLDSKEDHSLRLILQGVYAKGLADMASLVELEKANVG